MSTADTLVATQYRRLLGYLFRAVGDANTARDLTQEVFLRVAKGTIPGGPGSNVTGWLFKIARNVALDHHRARRRTPPSADLTDLISTRPSQDTGAAVNQALARLDEMDRDVFLMREVAGLGYQEIALACGLSTDAVRSRIYRARLTLRDLLAGPISASRKGAAGRIPSRHEGQTS